MSGRSWPPRSPTCGGGSPAWRESWAMFETLTERISAALRKLSGRGVLRPEDVEVALREVRLALLEADVNFRVVKDFSDRVREQAVGAEVMNSLSPAQQVVKIVQRELVALL